ncbi:L,D-transpeptidase [Methylopila jiangsuensis]|uniref:L,D-transpeptidase n=1 Tax=Methylopila jiangsuensis TaxID=586230 RepID=A0A9W6JEW2_9HYPH|nr:L,D-transpeptidase [Methylopila jiangsuensis]MDR6284163.1 lipoprotein-anchoring transpeptidase ErfK/SrfK [Methylopila jiangsuensis]GLK76320.1 L,D-transpeptidase [Methylopila jiangsuensis]
MPGSYKLFVASALAAASFALAGCETSSSLNTSSGGAIAAAMTRSYPSALPAEYRKQEVSDPTGEAPGTIVIDTSTKHLYLVESDGRALRYGVGVGREGFGWTGQAVVGAKQEWPDWVPPPEMLQRRPDLPLRMAGGPENPLGARALYLHRNGRDTLFRIHGTNEPHTIGKAMSSGCIRMINFDVEDLYARVPIGAKVVVR